MDKAIKFSNWLKDLIMFAKEQSSELTEQLRFKINETLQFIQEYDLFSKQAVVEFVPNPNQKSSKKSREDVDSIASSSFRSEGS